MLKAFAGYLEQPITFGARTIQRRKLVRFLELHGHAVAAAHRTPQQRRAAARGRRRDARRPAAIAALGSKRSPEEKAFAALLDGNLFDLEKMVKSISEPLPRLLAQIELVDLKWNYKSKVVNRDYLELLAADAPAWKNLIGRRLDSNDHWQAPGNYGVKVMLDQTLPIPDYTAASLVMNRRAMGEMFPDGDDIDFSVYQHYYKFIEGQGAQFLLSEPVQPARQDILDLLASVGEANLFKKLYLRAMVQALPEDAIELIGRYETLYQGHPELHLYRSQALMGLLKTKRGAGAENLKQRASKEEATGCMLFQGEPGTHFARWYCSYSLPSQDDFPRRDFARSAGSLLMSQGAVNSKLAKTFLSDRYAAVPPGNKDGLLRFAERLSYTCSDFTIVEEYYNELIRFGLGKEADMLVQENQHRFIGHPGRTIFLAGLKKTKRDYNGARELYEQAIAASPDTWGPYERLGSLYIQQGELKKASELYWRYPPFKLKIGSREMEDIDTVALSHSSRGAAMSFWRMGAIQYAIPFLRISADLDTGSGSSMSSRRMLSQLDGDYARAAREMLELARRYNDIGDYAYYVALLHLLGYHEEAWSLYSNMHMADNLATTSIASLVGHRMAGKTEKEQRTWILGHKMKEDSSVDTQVYLLWTHLTDRVPEADLGGILDEIEVHRRKAFEKEIGDMDREYGIPVGSSVVKWTETRSWYATFAEGYRYIKLKKFADAAATWRAHPGIAG
ncbi:MAG: tetratricopeptide repeat protein, partial [Nitrospirae bacterium]|nr:tetratricopeptide repeat protein [Nitrospirota bacterium]